MVLGIETSDDYVGIGMADDSGIIISRASEPEMRNKNILHEFLRETMLMAEYSLSDIDGVSVSLGPGSFTGLRVGLAAAKGICWADNIPLTGISSIEAIVHSVDCTPGRYIAAKDARRNEFYYGGFEFNGSGWRRLYPERTGSTDDILGHLEEGFKLIGRRHQLRKSGASLDEIIEYNPADLGGIVALLGRDKLVEDETLDIAPAAPRYIRDPGIVPSRR